MVRVGQDWGRGSIVRWLGGAVQLLCARVCVMCYAVPCWMVVSAVCCLSFLCVRYVASGCLCVVFLWLSYCLVGPPTCFGLDCLRMRFLESYSDFLLFIYLFIFCDVGAVCQSVAAPIERKICFHPFDRVLALPYLFLSSLFLSFFSFSILFIYFSLSFAFSLSSPLEVSVSLARLLA